MIAHEFGHHVQNLLGILPKVQQQQRGMDRAGANRLQVEVELQADCFAGIWANHENNRLPQPASRPLVEPGDVEAALQTASAIGDDTLQRQATGRVVPDSFTHGTSAQRQRWFQNGFRRARWLPAILSGRRISKSRIGAEQPACARRKQTALNPGNSRQ